MPNSARNWRTSRTAWAFSVSEYLLVEGCPGDVCVGIAIFSLSQAQDPPGKPGRFRSPGCGKGAAAHSGTKSVEFNAIAYQIHMAVTALVAYHNRTGADMSRWFGQHQLPRKVRPQPSLAQAA